MQTSKHNSVAEQTECLLETIENNRKRVVEAGRTIFQLAEVSGREFESSRLLVERLRAAGFTIQYGLDGRHPTTGVKVPLPTAFRAVRTGSGAGPCLGIMLEYDALEMGHACGHNLIAAAGLSVALGLAPLMDHIPGSLVVLGTPAEEKNCGGKVEMLAGGYFEGLDLVFADHAMDRWNVSTEMLAVVAVKGEEIVFEGVASHASASPEKGKSALDAAMLFGIILEFTREHVRQDTRIHYVITDGGQAPNVVPARAGVNVFVRSRSAAYLKHLQAKVDRAARAATIATDTSARYEWDYPWCSPITVPGFSARLFEKLEHFGVDPDDIRDEEGLGSSDVGNVGYDYPLAHLCFKIAPRDTAAHSPDFMAAADSEEGYDAMITASKILATSMLELFHDSDRVAAIRSEFKREKKKDQDRST